jgi:leucyl-tRNA synthetase
LRRKVHQTIERVTEDIDERIHLNTAVAALMELSNTIHELEPQVAEGPARAVLQEAIETLVLLLAPFAPHIGEEMWERLGRRRFVVDRPWPVADPALAREESVELAVQVNGKVRARITLPRDAGEDQQKAQALDAVKDHVTGKQIVKVVVVPGRLVSVVVR